MNFSNSQLLERQVAQKPNFNCSVMFNAKGWHNSFQHQLSACHPSIWKCIDALNREKSLHEMQIEHYVGDVNEAGSRRKYVDCAQRLQNTVFCFDDTGNVKKYLSVADNISY